MLPNPNAPCFRAGRIFLLRCHMQYQLFPDLSKSEYDELKADIADRGVMVPVEYDDQGNILDGHHRKRACDELGIKDFPRVVRYGWTEKQKRQHVRKLNLARRHLSQKQKREVIAEALKDEPEKSNRQHGRELGVSKDTVNAVREDMEKSGEISHISERTDPRTGKKSQKATKPKKPKSTPPVYLMTDKQLEKATEPEVARLIASGEAKTPAAAARMVSQPEANGKPKSFDKDAAGDRLCDWLREELKKWPEKHRHIAAHWIRQILEKEFNL
jgi:ParB-like chromosome segregation protein Spo0J